MRTHTSQTRKRIYIHVQHFTTPSCTYNILQPFERHNQTFDFFCLKRRARLKCTDIFS